MHRTAFTTISSVQFSCSVKSNSSQPHGLQHTLSITSSWNLLKLMSIESVMQSNHLILSRPLLLLPSVFFSIRVFSNESVLCIRWPKYWGFSFSISPSNEYSGLISFRIDWLYLLQSKVIFSIINFFLFLTWNAFYFLIFANFHMLSSLRSSAFSSVKSLQML